MRAFVDSPAQRDGMDLTLVEILRQHAERAADAPCLTFGEQTQSFGDLDRRSNQVANALIERGVGPGDRIVILSHASPDFFELAFGCAKAGAMMMPLNWRLSPSEIAGIIADGQPKLILVGAALAPLLEEAQPVPRIEMEAYAGWRDQASSAAPGLDLEPDDAVLLLYTSGTTGKPKGVMIGSRGLAYNALTARDAWGFTADSVNLVAMPLFHIGGIGYGMMALSQGGHTVLLQQPDPPAVIDAMNRHGVTHAFFVPTVIQRLVDFVEQSGLAPPPLQRLVYGAAPIGETLLKRALDQFGCGFSHAYGMTETSGTVITLPPEDHDPHGPNPTRLRSCGRPLPWVEMDLVDPATGSSVAVGEVGEIRIRSAMNMLGYWRNPQETAAAITSEQWLCTGDAAYRDVDGYVYIHDRYKDMIVSGGENIYPAELENVLQAHPDVLEVAVIGVAHSVWGETPRAYVVARGDATPSEAELIAFTRDRLARYKCPTSVAFVEALPRNASGKLLKLDLRELDAQLSRSSGEKGDGR